MASGGETSEILFTGAVAESLLFPDLGNSGWPAPQLAKPKINIAAANNASSLPATVLCQLIPITQPYS
jgi:hypothetical protein